MVKYLLLEKGTAINFKRDIKTIEEHFNCFEPIEEFKEEHEAWEEARAENTIDSLIYFIENYVNNLDGMHYHDYKVEEW